MVTVQTEGRGGYLATDLVGNGQHASELPKWCDSNKPDLVLMQFCTNDVWNDRSPSGILDAYSTVLEGPTSREPERDRDSRTNHAAQSNGLRSL